MGGTFFGGGTFFQKTPPFEGWYVYLGRYIFEKLLRRGWYIYLGWYVYLALDSKPRVDGKWTEGKGGGKKGRKWVDVLCTPGNPGLVRMYGQQMSIGKCAVSKCQIGACLDTLL